MAFFDGQFKSKQSINLSGSSRERNKDEIIRQAFLERKRRETEKAQQHAAVKIQSVFRSHLIRKRLREASRKEFDQLMANTKEMNVNNIRTLCLFALNFGAKMSEEDKQRHSKLTMLILQKKEHLLNELFNPSASKTEDKTFVLTFGKFLLVQMRNLNDSQSHSTVLRLIDYFTDIKTHKKIFKDQTNAFPTSQSSFLFVYLIKNRLLNHLIEYARNKIPQSVQNTAFVPLATQLGDIFYRCFVYLQLNTQSNKEFAENNKIIVNSLSNEFFSHSNLPQVRCILHNLKQLITNEIKADSARTLPYLSKFLADFCRLTFEQQQNQVKEVQESSKRNRNFKSIQNISEQNLLKVYCVLKLFSETMLAHLTDEQCNDFIHILKHLIIDIQVIDYFSDEQTSAGSSLSHVSSEILSEIIANFDSKSFAQQIESKLQSYHKLGLDTATSENLREFCVSISHIANFVLISSKSKIHQSPLLKSLAFNRYFLTNLWKTVNAMKIEPEPKKEIFLIHLAALGTCPDMYYESMLELVAPLSTFCSLYSLFLLTILDVEFLKGEAIFTKLELIKMCSILRDVCIGTINYMHPDPDNIGKPFSSSTIKKEYADWNSSRIQTSTQQEAYLVKRLRVKHFTHMFQMCCQLVQRLNTRDIRRAFCPEDHWVSHNDFNQNMAHSIHVIHRTADFFQVNKIRFGQSSYLFFDENELDFSLSTSQIRCMTIMQELPFTIPFTERLKIFENFTESEPVHPGSGSVYKIRIRRNYFYEDAFENLSHQNAPNLKTSRLVIEMINQYGLDEAGIDGGGLFRDFILQLLETGFDPNRGFFVMSSDGLLYPNPNVAALVDDYKQHYFFLGRMLAKSIQCEIFSQLKFAGFFMQKILSKYSDTRLDIDYLASFDPEIYKNLIFLKDYDENIENLDLNFTLQLNEFGENKVVELKPGGKDIIVTNDNKIEYIHLLADYKLNKQIQEQVIAFKMGISDIIDLDLLRLFNFNELQNLISGGNESIDVEDWKSYTVYQGNYHKDHPVIENFWQVVESFSEDEKRKLLRFATSRSFPPLFGFRNLLPNFAIQNSGSADRLPTASTCLNLLKLPPLEDFDLLKEKLLCAIESDAGFELS